MGVGPHYGFATISTDTGHSSSTTGLEWANNQPGDADRLGLESSARIGRLSQATDRRLLQQALSRTRTHSGCSTGGRQGLREIQEFPDSFDGALVGAPAWYVSATPPQC